MVFNATFNNISVISRLKYLNSDNKTPSEAREWLLFNTKWAIMQLYHGENKLHSMKWWWCSFCTRPTHLVGFFIVLAHWNNSPLVDNAFHSDTLFWFRANQSLILPL